MRYAKYAAAACALLAVITFSLVSHADTSSSVAIGAPAPGFSLQDQNGKTINLSDYTGKTVVLEWVNPECPFVKRHYAAKTMITLANDFSEKDVVLAGDQFHRHRHQCHQRRVGCPEQSFIPDLE